MAVKRVIPQNVPDAEPTIYSKPLSASILYANDFQSLLDFLRENAVEVDAIGGEQAYLENGNDLHDLRRKERRNLVITTKEPAVTINMGQANSRVQTREVDTATAKSLVDDVARLIGDWRSLTARLSPWWVFASIVFPALLMWSYYGAEPDPGDDKGSPAFVWLFSAAIAAMGTWVGLVSLEHRVLVRSKTRGQSQDARLRFVGNLAIGVLAGIAGALATYFVALQDK